MVHALREVHRVLHADGVLIDFRPLHSGWRMDISIDDRIILVEDGLDDAPRIPRDESADRALEQVQSEGWFQRESLTQIEHLRGWYSMDDLIDFWADKSPPLHFPDETLVRARAMLRDAGQDALVRIVHPIVIGFFRKTNRLTQL
jgi:hypothetical protein